MPEKISIVVDEKQRLPACVLIQAGMGGDSHFVAHTFDARHWLTGITDDMRLFSGTAEQWRGLAKELDDKNRLKLR